MKLLFGNFKQTWFVLENNFYITNKVELTLIAHEESSEVETFTYIFYLLIFNKIVSMNLVAKNSAQRKLKTPWIMKMMQKTTGCAHTNQPLKDNPLLLTPLKCIQMHFNVMSWIRLVIIFWTSQPHFVYLVHSRAGLQSKLCSPYCTEDNL